MEFDTNQVTPHYAQHINTPSPHSTYVDQTQIWCNLIIVYPAPVYIIKALSLQSQHPTTIQLVLQNAIRLYDVRHSTDLH